ncbi:MAG: YdcF family protein [Elusimicrobia bacterium]|nr:YdcF family protein [Elusimicrobiota bacterium]
MIHIISKFFVIPLYPAGFIATFGLLALILLAFNKRKMGYIAFFLSIFGFIFFSSPIVAHKLMRSLESQYSPAYTYPKVSAVVLLGGSEMPKLPPRIYYETNQNADRIMHAARLFKKGYAPYLITTGGQITFIKEFPGSEAEISCSLLTELFGINSAKILMDTKSKNTHDNAVNVKELLEKYKLKPTIILVTSAYHMPRSVLIFEKQGFTVYPAPTDYYADKDFQLKIYTCLPDSGALVINTTVLHEYYGILAYKILGWI